MFCTYLNESDSSGKAVLRSSSVDLSPCIDKQSQIPQTMPNRRFSLRWVLSKNKSLKRACEPGTPSSTFTETYVRISYHAGIHAKIQVGTGL